MRPRPRVERHVGDALDLALDLRLDGLAATMTLIVGGVGVLVFLCVVYFGPDTPNIGRLSGVLVSSAAPWSDSSRPTTSSSSIPSGS